MYFKCALMALLFCLIPNQGNAAYICTLKTKVVNTEVFGYLNCLNPFGYDIFIISPFNGMVARRLEASDGPSTRLLKFKIPSRMVEWPIVLKVRGPDS